MADSFRVGNSIMTGDEAKQWFEGVRDDKYASASDLAQKGITAQQMATLYNYLAPENGVAGADTAEAFISQQLPGYQFNQQTGALEAKPAAHNSGASAPAYREAAAFVDPGSYKRMSAGDYDALQKSLYEGATAGLQKQEADWRQQADQSMSNRGIWSSGIAQRAQDDITGQLGSLYAQAGAYATAQRYAAEQADNQGESSYNLSKAGMNNDYNLSSAQNYNNWASNMYNMQNQYTLGLQQNSNQLQSINDQYALGRADVLNNANAQASNAAWQAQWTPVNTLSGIWNGTAGTISTGSSGGGWNFMI